MTRTNSKKNVQLKLTDDILTSPIEVTLQSSDIADEEQLFFLQDEEEESEHFCQESTKQTTRTGRTRKRLINQSN